MGQPIAGRLLLKFWLDKILDFQYRGIGEMKTATYFLSCLALCAITVAALTAAKMMNQATETMKAWQTIPQQVVVLSDVRLKEVERIADTRMASLEKTADRRLKSIQVDANAQLSKALVLEDQQFTSLRQDLISEVHPISVAAADTLTAYGVLPKQIKPTIDTVNELSGPLLRNALGTVAAMKMTSGEADKTLKIFREAAPELIAAVQRSADGSAKTAQAAADLTVNLAQTFKPLPRKIQIPLAIIGGVGSAVYPWAGMVLAHLPANVNVTSSATKNAQGVSK